MFKLPEQKAFDVERVDALCREVTDLTGLVFVVWDADGRFWMPVGFSSTLTGLIAGCETLRHSMGEAVQAAFRVGEVVRETPIAGLQYLTVPIRRRRRTAFVFAAAVLTDAGQTQAVAEWLSRAPDVSAEEATQRLSGEACGGWYDLRGPRTG